jgi:hypothetical protein
MPEFGAMLASPQRGVHTRGFNVPAAPAPTTRTLFRPLVDDLLCCVMSFCCIAQIRAFTTFSIVKDLKKQESMKERKDTGTVDWRGRIAAISAVALIMTPVLTFEWPSFSSLGGRRSIFLRGELMHDCTAHVRGEVGRTRRICFSNCPPTFKIRQIS